MPLKILPHERVAQVLEAVPTEEGGCVEWPGHLCGSGYGQFEHEGCIYLAHRVAYEIHGGQPIPDGLQIDHLCRNRACVNPAHLEAVTRRENILRGQSCCTALNARKTHCKHGHAFTPENTLRHSSGGRRCRACVEAYNRRRRVSVGADDRLALNVTVRTYEQGGIRA